MRILHVIPNLERGGAERALLSIAQFTLQQGHGVRIVVLGDKNAYPEETAGELQPHFLHFRNSYRRPWDVLRCRNRLRDLFRAWRPDVVHSHLWPAARMAGWALRGSTIPHLVHIQDTMGWLSADDLRSRLMRCLTRTALRRPNTHFVAVGNAVAEYTHRHLPWIPSDISVIHNAFDASRFFRCARSTKEGNDSEQYQVVFGTAARLVPNKGIDRLLTALHAIAAATPWELHIAGDGGHRARLESLAASLGVSDRVHFLGTVTDMRAFYHRLHVYVQPSLSLEGLPLVLTEAMACGLPIIATDVGATRELVRDGIDGLVVPPDDVPALTHAIETLAGDASLRLRMSHSAQERAWSEFTSRRMGDKILETYASILSASPPERRAPAPETAR